MIIFLLTLCHAAMVTEPALNSVPSNPMKIASKDLPIRIEAAIQVDYNYSDFYQIYWPASSATRGEPAFIYLFDGCSQTECPKNPIKITINAT